MVRGKHKEPVVGIVDRNKPYVPDRPSYYHICQYCKKYFMFRNYSDWICDDEICQLNYALDGSPKFDTNKLEYEMIHANDKNVNIKLKIKK